MKKLTICTIAIGLLAACQPKQTNFVINGIAPDSTLNGNTVYLVDINENKALDSALIADCKFSFTGEVAQPTVRRIQVGRAGADIILDNSTTAEITLGRPSIIKDNGGYNEKFAQIVEKINEGFAGLRELNNNLMNEGLPYDSIEVVMNQKVEEVYNIFRQSMTENKDNILGGYILMSAANMLYNSSAALDSAMAAIPSSNEFTYLKNYRNVLARKEATKPGMMFTDFKGKDLQDNETALSNYVGKGKYVLVDFWASWCGPCRAEIPNLVELEKQYGGKDFMVLGVNVWDQKAAFTDALKNNGINYAQMYASDDNTATELYGIEGIPQIILFAPDGTIVARDLRGAAMKNLVAEKLGK